MAKTNKELEYYRVLRAKMMVKAEMQNVNWARYYANLLDLGGVNNEQYLKNYFNDDNKRFNTEQLATILLDLEDVKEIEIITQCQMEREVLKATAQMGKIIEKMNKHFDLKNEIELHEILPIVPETRELYSQAKLLYLRVEETKVNL